MIRSVTLRKETAGLGSEERPEPVSGADAVGIVFAGVSQENKDPKSE